MSAINIDVEIGSKECPNKKTLLRLALFEKINFYDYITPGTNLLFCLALIKIVNLTNSTSIKSLYFKMYEFTDHRISTCTSDVLKNLCIEVLR